MKVHVLYDEHAYVLMWKNNGHKVVELSEADVVQFTGGADVSPQLYGEQPHPQTFTDPMRDDYEISVFEYCRENGIPMVGICRGGQFLNVMCGGKLFQHVDGHAIHGEHVAVDTRTGKMVSVTSTHHQMMRPGPDGLVLLVASEATFLEHVEDGGTVRIPAKRGEDCESVWYPNEQVLCYQPHPEFVGKTDQCQDYYFDLIREFLGG